jgi:hypothetical protein
MGGDPVPESALVTPLHRAVYKVLLDAGYRDTSEGEDSSENSTVGMACILTLALSAYPSEDQLLDTMTWGRGQEHWPKLRPVARKLLALIDSRSSPA